MLEFKWQVPDDAGEHVVLQIRSRRGWIGPKRLMCAGQTVFRRGPFAGIETRFRSPGSQKLLNLKCVREEGTAIWRPSLCTEGEELPELSGTLPPHLVARPRAIAIITGVAYLTMLMAVVMLLSIVKILNAVYLPHDDRKFVLTVAAQDPPADQLAIGPQVLPIARQGEPYRARLIASGGTLPYAWEEAQPGWPKQVQLDSRSGEIVFTPRTRYDCSGAFSVIDAEGQMAEGVFVVVVRPLKPAGADWPTIAARRLPLATPGRDYAADFQVAGGRGPFTWLLLKGDLPVGLRFDREAGLIEGSVEGPPGHHLLTVRVEDGSYRPRDDIEPWVIPILVTAVCLLGFWNMRRWGVYVLGPLIVAQAVLAASGVLPASTLAIVLQGLIWCVGAAYLSKMH